MSTIKSIGYNIHIGSSALSDLSVFLKEHSYTSYYILCDSNTLEYCWPIVLKSCSLLKEAEIIEVDAGESSKSLEISAHIWQTLIENNADKKTVLINIGGGVVSDLGGFIASVYKRGIDFINIPTSLLAMADASVGGKNGIDFGDVKNSIGTITQPQAVFIYPDFIKTLPNKQIKNGMAEVYKMGLIANQAFWKKLSNSSIDKDLEPLIIKSVTLKNNIVKKDPFEKGLRKALNFGHTIGHAIESTLLNTKEELLHGEAIVIGMITEAWLSWQKKLLSKDELNTIIKTFHHYFELKEINETLFDKVITTTLNDKKNNKQEIRCVLLNGIGQVKIDVAITSESIKKALLFYNNIVKT